MLMVEIALVVCFFVNAIVGRDQFFTRSLKRLGRFGYLVAGCGFLVLVLRRYWVGSMIPLGGITLFFMGGLMVRASQARKQSM